MDTQVIVTKTTKKTVATIPNNRAPAAPSTEIVRPAPVPHRTNGAVGHVLPDVPTVLEGDGAAARRLIERWKDAERSLAGPPIMSMAAAIALDNGWLLDDVTGRIVARVDVGWFLHRMRAQPKEQDPAALATPTWLNGVPANEQHVRAA
jgi:hypothetical protein